MSVWHPFSVLKASSFQKESYLDLYGINEMKTLSNTNKYSVWIYKIKTEQQSAYNCHNILYVCKWAKYPYF